MILLVVKKRNDKLVQLFIVIVFLVTINTLAASLAACALDPDLWLILITITVITGLLAISIVFHFSYVFLKQGTIFEFKKVLVVYGFPLVLISMLLFKSRVFWPEVVVAPDRSNYGIFDGTDPLIPYFWSFYNLYQALILVLVTINFIRAFREMDYLEMQQRRAAFFILASLVPAIALTINSFFEYIGYTAKLESSVVATSITMSIITLGIFKAQLFDIKLIVSKSVKYTLLNIILAWIFVISRETMIPIVSDVLFSGNQVATLMAGFIVVTVFIPMKNAASKFTEKLFPQMSRIQSPATEYLKVYRTLLECVWAEEKITEKERRTLTAMRSSLGISEEDAQRVEREIIGAHD